MSGYLTADGADYLLGLFSSGEKVAENYYVALILDAEPGLTSDGDDIDEPYDTSYARAEMPNSSGSWVVMHGTVTSATPCSFPMAASDWGIIRYWAICDSLESGKVLWVGQFANPFFVGGGDVLELPTGSISVGFDMYGWGG